MQLSSARLSDDVNVNKKDENDKVNEKNVNDMYEDETNLKSVTEKPSMKSRNDNLEVQKTNKSKVTRRVIVPAKRSPVKPKSKSKKYKPLNENRRLIDKNIVVKSNLNDSEFYKEPSKLNFSYSKFDESDIEYMRDQLKQAPVEDFEKYCQHLEAESQEQGADSGHLPDGGPVGGYADKLQAAGNDRKVANIIRDTMSKPKSILLRSGAKDLKKVQQ